MVVNYMTPILSTVALGTVFMSHYIIPISVSDIGLGFIGVGSS